MIKNIIFDIGNVLVKFTPMEFLKNKYSDDEIVQVLYKEIFCGKEWIELDRGTLTDEEAVKIIGERNPQYKNYIIDVMETWHDMHIPVEGTPDILKSLRYKGYKIFLLSNYHKKAFEIINTRYDFIRNVDGKIISNKVKLLKPDYAIYEALTKKYSLHPEESIFIDDTLANVQAARELKFNALPFKDADSLQHELNELITEKTV